MIRVILQILLFLVFVVAILLGEKYGHKREVFVGIMSIVFTNVGVSLYRLMNKTDLSDSFLKAIFILRGRREALFWGWFIWAFALVCFILSTIWQAD